MKFPLSLSDIGLWMAFMAIVLLITSELLSSSTTYIVIEKKRLRMVALAFGVGFMIIVIIRVFHPF